jgi:hypothetical protein
LADVEHVTATGIGLLIAPYVLGLIFLTLALLTPQRMISGWSHVTPGAYWVVAVLSLLLSLFIAYVWAFVGSVRVDAASQMSIAWWLSFVFGLAGAWSLFKIWRIRKMALRWRGQSIAFMRDGREFRADMKGMAVFKRTFTGSASIVFKDGTKLPIDLSASRGMELFEKILVVHGLREEVPEH